MQILSIETERADNCGSRFGQAAELIAASWRENRDQALDYNSEFLRSCYEYPGVDPSLSPAIFVDGRMVAMVSAFPRSVILDGKPLRLALLTFLTTASGMKGNGFGLSIFRQCLQRVQAAGFDGAVHYCVASNKTSNSVTVAAAESLGFAIRHVFTVHYMMRFIPGSTPTAAPCAGDESFRAAFADHALRLAVAGNFCRTWNASEIDWECNERCGAICASYDGRPQDGLLTGYVLGTAAGADTQCLFIENIFWGDLDEAGRKSLVNSLLSQVVGRAQIALVPLMGYADTSVFASLRFRQALRNLNAYLTVWNGAGPCSLPSMYIDVL